MISKLRLHKPSLLVASFLATTFALPAAAIDPTGVDQGEAPPPQEPSTSTPASPAKQNVPTWPQPNPSRAPRRVTQPPPSRTPSRARNPRPPRPTTVPNPPSIVGCDASRPPSLTKIPRILDYGESVTCRLDPDSQRVNGIATHTYRIRGNGNQTLPFVLSADQQEPNLSPTFTLQAEDGSTIYRDRNAASKSTLQIQIKLPADGDYTILIGGSAAARYGIYTLAIGKGKKRSRLDQLVEPRPSSSPQDLRRASNMARMFAERHNGGLSVYRTDACMYERGGGSCLIRFDEQGYLFRFRGGSPGWQPRRIPPTKETEILIAPRATEQNDIYLIYNGPPRREE